MCAVRKIFSVFATLWIAKVFLLSLPYKFSGHPDTQHIFGTIWEWMSVTINQGLGQAFSKYGAYVIGSGELIVSLMLLFAAAIVVIKGLGGLKNKETPNYLFGLAGFGAMIMMIWAVFFHTQTPLGIEVIHEGKSDGGSLFKAAVSILFIGMALFLAYFGELKQKFLK